MDKSIAACVSAIEIYNKPDSKFREENFSIFMINAWELLLKAKIVKDSNNQSDGIFSRQEDGTKKTRSGNPKTISISRAVNILEASGKINRVVCDNIRLLMDIKTESVYLLPNDVELSEKIQSIGTASLKNFITLAMDWFGCDLQNFNFYLMPVSFCHHSDAHSFNLDKSTRENLIKYFTRVEKEYGEETDPNFSLSLKLETTLVKTPTVEV